MSSSSLTRKETERTKYIQEKCQTILTSMLRDEDNKYCVDCDAKGPRWASFNIGVFLCIRCAGIHRNLGVHISRVKSVNLDSWTPEQVVSLQQMGNSRARAVYEAQLPDGFRRPQNDSALESFIRAKYEHKKYLAKEWVQTPMPKVDWNKEIDEELDKQKKKKKSTNMSSLSLTPNSSTNEKKSSVSVKTPLPAPLPKPKATTNSPKSTRIDLNQSSSASSDLLGLTSPVPVSASADNSLQLENDNDIFSNFLSSPVLTQTTAPVATNGITTSSALSNAKPPTATNLIDNLSKQEAEFFNQSVPSEKEKAKLTKDSILALYGTAPTNNFNKPAGMGYNNFSSLDYQQAPAQASPQMINNPYPAVQGQPNYAISGMPTHQMQFMPQNPAAIGPNAMQNGLNMFNLGQPSGHVPQGQQLPQQQQFNQYNFPNQSPFSQITPSSNFQLNAQQPQPQTNNLGKLNQKFDNMNLGNVWQ